MMDYRVPASLTRAIRRRSVVPSVAALTALLVIGAAAGAAFRQVAVDAPSPARGYAQVIAQGVGELPATEVVWRVLRDTVGSAGEAVAKKRRLGFVLADGGVLAIEDAGSGSFVRLAPGEAAFVPENAEQTQVNLGADGGSAYRMELLPADEAQLGGAVFFVSAPFAGPASEDGVDLDLVRSALAPGQNADLSDTGLPKVILVTAGRVEVAAGDDDPVSLAAGEAGAFTGAVTVTGKEQGAFVAAVIGPAVPRLLPEAEPGESNAADTDDPGATDDADGDGLSDFAETNIHATDPDNADTDGDGLNDGEELFAGTSPVHFDSDDDGIGDGEELAAGTDAVAPCVSCLPSDEDEDGDGVTNGDEIDAGTDPFDPNNF